MNKAVSALRAHRVTIAVWIVIIAVIAGIIANNRAQAAREDVALSSSSQNARDAMVRTLVDNGQLVDVLTNTEDPNSDSDSPQNKASATIRENAAASVDRLTAAGQVPPNKAMDTLFLLCKDSDATVKTTAENGLAALGKQSPAELNDIVARLKDGDPDIRGAAVDVLGMIPTTKTAKKVDAVINDPASQDSAESALAKIGDPAVPFLSAHLNDPNATIDFRQKIIDLLGGIGTVSTIPPLTAQAQSDQPSLRREAVLQLANIVLSDETAMTKAQTALQKAQADPKTKPADLKTDQTAITTADAAFATAKKSEPFLVAALTNTHADSQVRSQAALALGDIGGAAAIASLTAALGDFDSQVQQAVISGLQSVGPTAVAPLTAALTKGDEQTRASAAQALGGIGNAPAIAALNQTFANPATPPSVRQSAAVGLGRSGSVAVIPTLVRALGDKDGDVEAAASAALLSPQLSAAAIAPLIGSFSQPTPVPFLAAQTLSRMGEQAVPALVAATRSPNPAAQTWAAITLGQTGSKQPTVLPALTTLAKSPNSQVQFAATEAITQLSSDTAGA